MEKLLTIIIPTYNMEKYLDKCLASLIIGGGKFEQLEVLVINDGSKDHSSEIAHGYESRYPQTFRVIDKENGNYGSCINRGLKEATGKYIKVLDADDSFDNDSFANFIAFLALHDVDTVISSFVIVDEHDNVTKIAKYPFPVEGYFPLSVITQCDFLMMHAVCYRTDNLRKINYHQTEGISYTDQEWIFLPMATTRTAVYFEKPLYRYMVGREGQTVNPSVFRKNIWQEEKGLRVMLDEYEQVVKNTPISLDSQEYLQWRLRHRAKLVYDSYLIRFWGKINTGVLRETDAYIKKRSEWLYEELQNVCYGNRIKVKYIRDWQSRMLGHQISRMLIHFHKTLFEWINR